MIREEHWHAGGDENKPGLKKVAILDSSGNQVSSFGVDDQFPAGTGDEENKTLTNASTAYAVPTSAPTEKISRSKILGRL
jgi:hypothetical protein